MHVLSVRQVFGVQLATPQCSGGRNDGAVPIREPMRRLDCQRIQNNFAVKILNGKAQPSLDQSCGNLVRQRVTTCWARSLHVELAENLNREPDVISLQQADRALSLRDFSTVAADGIEQYVRIEERQPGHLPRRCTASRRNRSPPRNLVICSRSSRSCRFKRSVSVSPAAR